MIIKFIFLAILILINGVFSATEMAFLSLNKYDLNQEIKNKNKKAVKILYLLNDSSTFLSAIQIVITLSGFLASAFAAESFASELAAVIKISWISEIALTNFLIVVITIILSYFTLIFGELVPKKIGLAYSKAIAFRMITIISFVIIFFKPFIIILRGSTNAILRILKVEKVDEKKEEEIKNSIVDSDLEELEKKILLNVFEFNDTNIEKIMTPRKDVIAIDIQDSKEKIMDIIRKTKFTRFPVLENGEMIGVLNIKEFVVHQNVNFELRDYIKKIGSISADMIIDDAFLLLNSQYIPIAKVEKEGNWVGIVTIEDIVEEVIGNIFDEYDKEKEIP